MDRAALNEQLIDLHIKLRDDIIKQSLIHDRNKGYLHMINMIFSCMEYKYLTHGCNQRGAFDKYLKHRRKLSEITLYNTRLHNTALVNMLETNMNNAYADAVDRFNALLTMNDAGLYKEGNVVFSDKCPLSLDELMTKPINEIIKLFPDIT